MGLGLAQGRGGLPAASRPARVRGLHASRAGPADLGWLWRGAAAAAWPAGEPELARGRGDAPEVRRGVGSCVVVTVWRGGGRSSPATSPR